MSRGLENFIKAFKHLETAKLNRRDFNNGLAMSSVAVGSAVSLFLTACDSE